MVNRFDLIALRRYLTMRIISSQPHTKFVEIKNFQILKKTREHSFITSITETQIRKHSKRMEMIFIVNLVFRMSTLTCEQQKVHNIHANYRN